jgi:hypothetical protein
MSEPTRGIPSAEGWVKENLPCSYAAHLLLEAKILLRYARKRLTRCVTVPLHMVTDPRRLLTCTDLLMLGPAVPPGPVRCPETVSRRVTPLSLPGASRAVSPRVIQGPSVFSPRLARGHVLFLFCHRNSLLRQSIFYPLFLNEGSRIRKKCLSCIIDFKDKQV